MDNENQNEKFNRGLDIFIESVIEPDLIFEHMHMSRSVTMN